MVRVLLLSFAATFVLSYLELKCEPISEHIFRARTSSILTSSVLHAKARPYEATMSSALARLGVTGGGEAAAADTGQAAWGGDREVFLATWVRPGLGQPCPYTATNR